MGDVREQLLSFAINPDVVKSQPKTFADSARAGLCRQVAYSNPATAGDGMAVLILTTSLMGEDKAFDYLAKLSQSVKFHEGHGLPERAAVA